jgi:hypothetical protein
MFLVARILTFFQIDWNDNEGDYSKNTIIPKEERGEGCIQIVFDVLALENRKLI